MAELESKSPADVCLISHTDITFHKWWNVGKFPTAPEIFPAYTRSRNLETLIGRFISLYQSQLKTKGRRLACTLWVRPIMMVNLRSRACFAMMSVKRRRSSRMMSLACLVEVAVGRIHHIGRGQAIVHPLLALFTKSLRNRTCSTTSWRVSCSVSKCGQCQSLPSRIKATSSLGISPPQPKPHQPEFYLQPSLVFIASVQMFAISSENG